MKKCQHCNCQDDRKKTFWELAAQPPTKEEVKVTNTFQTCMLVLAGMFFIFLLILTKL